ncbi:MAG TPA: WHG domain-containing protein [Acidimicrobiia bacterium]|nr:WHG domain-containing protein [Acidimicrobiia bacterium]
MPTPSRTSLDEIVASGRELIETDGLRSLTMNRVAGMVGVRAPSLYKHVANRADLVRLIAEDVIGELLHRLEHAVTHEDPRADLEALAHSFRNFAKEAPGAYQLVFQSLPADARPDPERLEAAAAPVIRIAERLVGRDRALEAARTFTAWAHGFVSMELAGVFRMGGDVDRAFAFGAERLGQAIAEYSLTS